MGYIHAPKVLAMPGELSIGEYETLAQVMVFLIVNSSDNPDDRELIQREMEPWNLVSRLRLESGWLDE